MPRRLSCRSVLVEASLPEAPRPISPPTQTALPDGQKAIDYLSGTNQ
jgi:hypothetical protein